jgi:hypothetical protein
MPEFLESKFFPFHSVCRVLLFIINSSGDNFNVLHDDGVKARHELER